MNKVVTFRIAAAALLVNLGCYALLAHWFDAALYFCFLPMVTMSRSDMTRPAPSPEVLLLLGVVLAFVILIMVCKWLIPLSASTAFDQGIRHPAFVFPFWLFLLWSLYRVYRRQKGGSDA